MEHAGASPKQVQELNRIFNFEIYPWCLMRVRKVKKYLADQLQADECASGRHRPRCFPCALPALPSFQVPAIRGCATDDAKDASHIA